MTDRATSPLLNRTPRTQGEVLAQQIAEGLRQMPADKRVISGRAK